MKFSKAKLLLSNCWAGCPPFARPNSLRNSKNDQNDEKRRTPEKGDVEERMYPLRCLVRQVLAKQAHDPMNKIMIRVVHGLSVKLSNMIAHNS